MGPRDVGSCSPSVRGQCRRYSLQFCIDAPAHHEYGVSENEHAIGLVGVEELAGKERSHSRNQARPKKVLGVLFHEPLLNHATTLFDVAPLVC